MNMLRQLESDSDFLVQYMREQHPDRSRLSLPVFQYDQDVDVELCNEYVSGCELESDD